MLTCPFHYITGWLCPFCGGQRMLLALLHGSVEEAFLLNPVVFVMCVMAAAIFVLHLYNCWRQKNSRSTCAAWLVAWCQSGTALLCLLTILVIWGVVRNLL